MVVLAKYLLFLGPWNSDTNSKVLLQFVDFHDALDTADRDGVSNIVLVDGIISKPVYLGNRIFEFTSSSIVHSN